MYKQLIKTVIFRLSDFSLVLNISAKLNPFVFTDKVPSQRSLECFLMQKYPSTTKNLSSCSVTSGAALRSASGDLKISPFPRETSLARIHHLAADFYCNAVPPLSETSSFP